MGAGLNWLNAQPLRARPADIRFDYQRWHASRRNHRSDTRLIRKVAPQKGPLAINDVVLEVVAMTGAEVMKNSVSVQTKLAKALPLILADRVQLQQAITNLIISAAEAMSVAQEGTWELLIRTARCDSAGILVSVRDSGPGTIADLPQLVRMRSRA